MTLRGKIELTPQQLIHGDITRSNMVVDRQESEHYISGILDFGDVIYSHRIIDLAIFCARSSMDPTDPLLHMLSIVRGYLKVSELTASEVELLLPLALIRLAYLLLFSHYMEVEEPENGYAYSSRAGEVDTYLRLLKCSNEEFMHRLKQFSSSDM